ncbi:hypothetical protein ACIBI9_66325 [Nonomuraea sp. NPDC050451]|uniref:hypothetical protein n=1 Tax=Nonomuraea sp. NPDC050451 TaxID=3364364 RepID=UPI0037AEE0CC
MGWTQAENDVADVMIWLRSNQGREVSYTDLAASVGINDGHRLRRAVLVVPVIAANRGDRLERFMPSTDPARRRVFATRHIRHGHGDEFSARDAMSAARAAMTSVKDMHRATTFEAANPHSIARKEFATLAQAADGCITKVAGIDKVCPHAVRHESTGLLTQMIAEPAAG